MFTLFIRGAVLYLTMILVMRGMGKRQLGEYQPFELAMTILLADVISAPMESVSVPLLNGLLPVAAMFTVHAVISLMSMRWDGFRALLSGRPQVVIEGGRIDAQALDRLCLSLSDLLEGLRAAGFLDPAEVDTAIVEANGALSAFAAEAGENAPGAPIALIHEGKLLPSGLSRAGRDAVWLENLLGDRQVLLNQVRLAALEPGGGVRLELMDGNLIKISDPGRGEGQP